MACSMLWRAVGGSCGSAAWFGGWPPRSLAPAACPAPAENGEAIQILKYVDGQKYEPHTDYFHDK